MPVDNNYINSLIKDLDSDAAPLYVDEMTSEVEPDTYVLLERMNYDNPLQRGDGKSMFNEVTFTIRIFSTKAQKIYELKALYESKLKAAEPEVSFQFYGPTMDPTDKTFSSQIIGRYFYGI